MKNRAEIAVVAVCGLLALSTSLAEGIHDRHTADSMLPALVSLQQWTFFYWGQDRYGMLIPFLTLPLRDPLAVLVAQHALSSFFGFLAFFAVARAVQGREGPWVANGALGATLFLACQPSGAMWFYYLGMPQPAGTSLALAAAALVVWREGPRSAEPELGNPWNPWRAAAGFLFALLALWVNVAAAVFMISVLVVDRILGPLRRELPIAIAGTLLAAAIIAFAMVQAPQGHFYGPLAITEWASHARIFAQAVWRDFLDRGLGLGLALSALGSCVIVATGARLPWRRVVSISTGGLAYLATFAVLAWTSEASRYSLLPLAVLAATGLAIPVARFWPTRRTAADAMVLVVFASRVWLQLGLPEPAEIPRNVDENFGTAHLEFLASDASAIIGNYWEVWPMVFQAERAAYDSGSNRRVYGITGRALPTREQWSLLVTCNATFAAARGDDDIGWLRRTELLDGRRLEFARAGEQLDFYRLRCDRGRTPLRKSNAS